MTRTAIHPAPPEGLAASITCIGAFDGVHRGHQVLIGQAVAAGRETGVPVVVWTFDPPPKVFFGRAPLLMSPVEKVARLAELGVDHIILSRFDDAFRAQTAEDFLALLARLNPVEVRVGGDFRFGARQAGDVALLAQHFNVRLLDPVHCDKGDRISSSRIRQAWSEGDLDTCRELIGWSDYYIHPEYETPF
jgi:riboflavin kinase/FMN adenylyltransferase